MTAWPKYTQPMKYSVRAIVLVLTVLVFAALPACGNKGPLVLPPPKAAAG